MTLFHMETRAHLRLKYGIYRKEKAVDIYGGRALVFLVCWIQRLGSDARDTRWGNAFIQEWSLRVLT